MTTEPTVNHPNTPPSVPKRSSATNPSKSATVIKLLLRARGATPVELGAATDWQAHSVRAFLSGLRKQGRVIVREARKSGEFAYRITVPTEPALAASAAPESDAPEQTAAAPSEQA